MAFGLGAFGAFGAFGQRRWGAFARAPYAPCAVRPSGEGPQGGEKLKKNPVKMGTKILVKMK